MNTAWPPPPGGTWVVDLDGVVWLADQGIPGVAEAVGKLRDRGVRVLFVTNNSAPTLAELVERLAGVGIAAAPDDLLTSAQAAATLLNPGDTAFVVADGGAVEALGARGVRAVDQGPASAVVIGWTHRFDFEMMATAATAVRGGARLIGTNEDPTHPTPQGLLPGAGSLLAAVTTAAGKAAEVAGKPYPPMVALVRSRADDVVAVVGDRPSTDGALAQQLGTPYALVLSGVTPPGTRVDPAPAVTAADLAALVDGVLAPG